MELLYILLVAIVTSYVLVFLTRIKQGMSPLDVVGDITTVGIGSRKRGLTGGSPSEQKTAGFNLKFEIEETS